MVVREDREYKPRNAEGEVRSLGFGNWQHPKQWLQDAKRFLNEEVTWGERKGRPKRVAFLASCSYMLKPIVKALREAGIPFHNSYRLKCTDWNPLADPHGPDTAAGQVRAFLRADDMAYGEGARMWPGADLAAWTAPLKADGLLNRGAKTLLEKLGLVELNIPDLESLFDHEQLLRLLEIMLSEQDHLGDLIAWYREHLLPTQRDRLDYALKVVQQHGVAVLEKEPQVVVGTGHSLKGGEVEVAYVMPDLSPAGVSEWITGGARRDAVLRLAYVMATRSSETLVLCPPAVSRKAFTWR